jgi:translation initiation factor IF-2
MREGAPQGGQLRDARTPSAASRRPRSGRSGPLDVFFARSASSRPAGAAADKTSTLALGTTGPVVSTAGPPMRATAPSAARLGRTSRALAGWSRPMGTSRAGGSALASGCPLSRRAGYPGPSRCTGSGMRTLRGCLLGRGPGSRQGATRPLQHRDHPEASRHPRRGRRNSDRHPRPNPEPRPECQPPTSEKVGVKPAARPGRRHDAVGRQPYG